MPHYFTRMPAGQQKKIRETKLTIYICEGEESEIKAWFKTINIAGIPLIVRKFQTLSILGHL